MKATFVTLAVAGFAAAQNLSGVDGCVRSCIEKAFPQVGCTGTEAEIAACACKPETQAKLLAPVTQCATQNKCDTSALIKAQSVAAEECKALASGSGSASGSASATATGSATESHSGSASATGSSAPVVSTLSTGTGGVPTQSKNQTATSTSGATGTTKAPTSSQGGSGSATRSGSGTVPTTTGAAAAGPVVGALAAVLAAALAL
ncbi:hypothetical protein J3459_021567 [Metarhizium acridum]|uniref:CFEM domain-containing protein n=1 Tax=Metarhizium acridum (strain CQMa 102) TaxID=655827 RepID=E9E4N2_METAQ|nr:uncharacterized protein MAC_04830 [Metarhizium acridum CQMa 102]EFY89055.1 hypothetical protein MAC_04830 [Metarhizium acridum CQMa 102]KAG8405701.1 hypothetical protein J3459_021567 [Metarhizium acridum]KAG8408796.1 hypothetical protein J3458_019812 [Metarhizium acridum]